MTIVDDGRWTMVAMMMTMSMTSITDVDEGEDDDGDVLWWTVTLTIRNVLIILNAFLMIMIKFLLFLDFKSLLL